MEASTYAWAVILTFFIFYATEMILQLLSSGETNTSSNRLSSSSVYTIENDSAAHSYRNDQMMLGSSKFKGTDLPTYEEVIASDRQNNSTGMSGISVGASSSKTLSDPTTSSSTLNR